MRPLIHSNDDGLDKWIKDFQELNKQVPPFPADKKMDVHWLSVMDDVASKHGVVISKRQVGEEKRTGDLYEMPIETSSV